MSEFRRVIITTKLDQLSQIMTDFQSEQLDYDRSGDRTCDFKHTSTLIIPLRRRSCSVLKKSHITHLWEVSSQNSLFLVSHNFQMIE